MHPAGGREEDPMMRRLMAAALMMTMAGMGWAAEGEREMKGDRRGPGGRMAAWLDLTPEQSTKIRALMDAHRKATRDLRDKRQDATRALRNLLEDKGSDAQITTKLNDLKAAHDALQVAQKKHRDELAKVLTPTQQAKFVLGKGRPGKAGRRPGMGGRRGDAPGHDGPMASRDEDEEDDD